MKDFFKGIGHMLAGLGIILQPRLRRFVLIPLLVNVILFALLISLMGYWFGALMEYLLGFLPGWLDWLRYILWPVFAVTALILVFYSFALVANLVAAPFNGLLAEAVEKHLTGESLEGVGDWRSALKDLWPSIRSEIVKLVYFLVRALPLLVLLIIPGINVLAAFAWAVFSSWMLAMEYMDYPMANHRLLFPEQRLRLKQRRMLSLGFGATATVLTLVPVLNFIAMPAAVAGATSAWVKEFRT